MHSQTGTAATTTERMGDVSNKTMTAVRQEGYGSPTEVLSVEQLPVPEVDADEVLVSVEASSVNPADWHGVRGEPLVVRAVIGVGSPSYEVPGCDIAGVVERVGSDVTSVRVGDRVLGYPPEKARGGFAEVVAIPESNIARVPDEVSLADAACLPLAGATALHAIRDHAEVDAGQRVLVVGASGGVGALAVQIAKSRGARVTGVCSGRNVDFVRNLGADDVLDYRTVDYAELAADEPGYDSILQLGGAMPAARLRRALADDGRLVIVSGDGGGRWLGPIGRILRGVVMSRFGRGRVLTMNAVPSADDLAELASLVASGAVRVPIERTVSLDGVAAAIRDIETGHTRGKIAVAI